MPVADAWVQFDAEASCMLSSGNLKHGVADARTANTVFCACQLPIHLVAYRGVYLNPPPSRE